MEVSNIFRGSKQCCMLLVNAIILLEKWARGLYKNGEKGNCMCKCKIPSVLLDSFHAPHLP